MKTLITEVRNAQSRDLGDASFEWLDTALVEYCMVIPFFVL